VTIEMQRRVVAFVRTIANECSSCLRNGSQYCNDCVAKRANLLLKDIPFDESPAPVIDYSFYARVDEIKRILSSSGRPMQAREINLRQTCSPQLKFWTLNQMVHNGILGRKVYHKKSFKFKHRKTIAFFYFIKQKETK